MRALIDANARWKAITRLVLFVQDIMTFMSKRSIRMGYWKHAVRKFTWPCRRYAESAQAFADCWISTLKLL